MAEHRFDQLTQVCRGCCQRASDVENDPKLRSCPAFYRVIGDSTKLVVITPDEELRIISGQMEMGFGQNAMFELRDAIDEGVRKLQEAKGD